MTLQQLSSTVSSESSICQTRIASRDAIVVDNGSLRLTVVPELGGKIVSLIRNERAYRPCNYADRFEEYEPSGFDECLPTIAACLYPEEPFSARRLPDHGDVWCSSSSVEIAGEQVALTTSIRSLPLRFTKKCQLQEKVVRLDYEVTNLSQSDVKFLWSAHPLLRVEPDAEIILPQEVKEVEVNWSKDNRLGKSGDRCTWPTTWSSIELFLRLLLRLRSYSRLLSAKASVECSCRAKMKASFSVSIPGWFHMLAFGFAKADGR